MAKNTTVDAGGQAKRKRRRRPKGKKSASRARATPEATQKRRGGHPPFVPTQEQKNLVMVAVASGYSHEQIASLLQNPIKPEPGISVTTLKQHFAHELATGAETMGLLIANNLSTTARDRNHKDHVRAAEFWLRARMGWRDKDGTTINNTNSQQNDHRSVHLGGADPAPLPEGAAMPAVAGPRGRPKLTFTLRLGRDIGPKDEAETEQADAG